MILRAASLDEMTDVARLHRRTVTTSLPFVPHLHTPDEDVWWFRERLFATNQVWVLEAGEGLAAYVAFRPSFIEHLFVAPEHQARGLGVRLLAKAQETNDELSLWTFQQNDRARRFYERQGFVAVAFTDGDDNEEKLPDVLYRWTRATVPI